MEWDVEAVYRIISEMISAYLLQVPGALYSFRHGSIHNSMLYGLLCMIIIKLPGLLILRQGTL